MSTRRHLLAALGALPAAAALPGSSAADGADERPATIEELAGITFKDEGSELKEAFGTKKDWMKQAEKDWLLFQFAGAAMSKNDVETHVIVMQAGTDSMVELAEWFDNQHHAYAAKASVLRAAYIRTLCGIAREAVRPDSAT